MTRKDYELIAKVFKDMPEVFWRYDKETTRDIAVVLSDALAEDNPRFDRARFLDACGVK